MTAEDALTAHWQREGHCCPDEVAGEVTLALHNAGYQIVPTGVMIPPYDHVAWLNGWGRRVKFHLWGAQFGRTSILWWDMGSQSPCWEFSRVRKP